MQDKTPKLIFATLLAALLLPFRAFAAEPSVLTVEVDTSSGIVYSGTTESGVLAVSCGLYDASDNELAFNSVATSGTSFSGTFDANSSAVVLRCANYDGGTIVSATLASAPASDSEDSADPANTPNTGAREASRESASRPVLIISAAVVLVAALAFVLAKRFRSR